jgi:monoamine oxidase
MWHRRAVLAGLGAAAAAGSAASFALRSRDRRDIVIIGAGIAGLAAGRMLSDAGHGVTVLEARPRIGGRIHTSRLWADVPVDLGASWIHGITGNPVTTLARKAGVPYVATDFDRARRYGDPALGLSEAGEARARAVVDQAIGMAEGLETDISLGEAVSRVLARRPELDPATRAQLAFHLAADYEQDYGGSIAALSARNIAADNGFGGPDAIFPQGYDALCEWLARGLDIRRNAPVRAIDRSGKGMRVTLADGSIAATDKVIVTAPLGVLKAGAIAFTPALPPGHEAAIAMLGMGLLNKHWLRFDAVRWPAEADWLEYVAPDAPGRWGQWVSLARTTGAPVLLAFSGADTAREIEAFPDRAIVAEAMGAARAMFGSSLPDPSAAQVTRWQADPWSRGAYSFTQVGSSPATRRQLARPIDDCLFFAGEAASADYPGTVHGALLSGQAAAGAILEG